MDDRIVLKEVIIRTDDSVLRLLSQVSSSLRSRIEEELNNQHVWYSRVDHLFDLPPWAQWLGNEKERWDQIYNILLPLLSGVNPLNIHQDNSTLIEHQYNYLGVKILISWGSLERRYTDQVIQAAAYGDVLTLRMLIAQLSEEVEAQHAGYALLAASSEANLENVRLLLEVVFQEIDRKFLGRVFLAAVTSSVGSLKV